MASEKNILKNQELEKALSTFKSSLLISTQSMDDITIDTIKNGQIQNFEYTLELLWKCLMSRIKETGLDLNSPKSVFRHTFTFSNLTDQEKEKALSMIDDRNKIAHEYKDYIMEIIYPKLSDYVILIEKLSQVNFE